MTIYLLVATFSIPSKVSESKSPYSGPAPSSLDEEVLVFLQVSDIHITESEPDKAAQFETFVRDVVSAIDPSFVLATGDLTDADKGVQSLQEWTTYQGIVNTYIANTTNFWYDVRGNHDAFGMGTRSSKSSYYEQFGFSSPQLRATQQGVQVADVSKYSYSFEKAASSGGQVYRFVGVDAVADPGLLNRLNFFGQNSPELNREIEGYLSADPFETPTIMFSHFPELTMTRRFSFPIRDSVLYYLNGHLHQSNMFQRSRKGVMIELEANDMKEDKGWRMLVWDHGVLSFTDMDLLKPFPVAAITNPKDARFLTKAEPNLVKDSSHIRIVAFTSQNENITSVVVRLDGGASIAALPCCGTGSRIFVAPWDPSNYSVGLHNIVAEIHDSANRSIVITQEFSVDGSVSQLTETGFQVAQLLGDFTLLLQIQFAGTIVYLFILLIVIRKDLSPRIFAFYMFVVAYCAVGP